MVPPYKLSCDEENSKSIQQKSEIGCKEEKEFCRHD